MPGRDNSEGSGRSEEDRLKDLAARERARLAGKRPPPSFGPSTRAGRERAAERGADAVRRPVPTPAARQHAGADASLDFDFARPSTRAAGGAAAPPEPPRESGGASPERDRPNVLVPGTAGPGARTRDRPPTEPGTGTPFAPLRSPAPGRDRKKPGTKRPTGGSRRSPRRAGGSARLAGLQTSARSLAGRAGDAAGAAATLAARNRLGAAALVLGLVIIAAVLAFAGGGDDGGSAPAEAKAQAPKKKSPYGKPTATPGPPETRWVAYAGAPQADEFGILGTMPVEKAADKLERQSAPYDRRTRPVMPAFDLIATIANAHPGRGGKYRTRQSSKTIARYLRAARRHNAALILDVQPGTSNFVDEVKPLERWLKEPDVHLALDPEWRMRPGVAPGTEIGWVSAGEITATLDRVATIVRANKLPPKVVIVHRFTDGMIKDLPTVDVPKEVVGVISIDGVGNREEKRATYDRIAPTLPKPWLPGFKVFYVEDREAGGLFSGKQVMALKPRPHVVLYE